MRLRGSTPVIAGLLSLMSAFPANMRAQSPDTAGTGALVMLDSLRTANPQEYKTFRTMLILATQMGLGRLGFGPVTFTGVADSATAASVRRFERARRLPTTGDLFAPSTFQQINADMSLVMKSDQRPSLGFKNFTWGIDGLIAEGPWYMEGEPETYMVVHVYCDRARSECRLAWAKLGASFLTARALAVLTETFQVGRWDETEIMSEPLDYPCTRYLLRVNRVQETVVMTRSTLSAGEACRALEVRDLVTRLIPPDEWPPIGSVRTWNPLELYSLGPAARSVVGLKPR